MNATATRHCHTEGCDHAHTRTRTRRDGTRVELCPPEWADFVDLAQQFIMGFRPYRNLVSVTIPGVSTIHGVVKAYSPNGEHMVVRYREGRDTPILCTIVSAEAIAAGAWVRPTSYFAES